MAGFGFDMEHDGSFWLQHVLFGATGADFSGSSQGNCKDGMV